jgi:hypothetical protein
MSAAGFGWCRFLKVAVLAASFAGSAGAASPTQVYLEAGHPSNPDVGQGMLFRWRDTCFGLTANHVVAHSDRAMLVAGSNATVRGAAIVLARFVDDDLALVRVSGGLERGGFCDVGLDSLRVETEALNRGDGTGTLSLVDREGQILRSGVVFKTLRPQVLQIEPRDPRLPGDRLFEGRSGSLVYRGETPTGILVRISEQGGGRGEVVSMTRVLTLVDQYFARPVPGTATAVAPSAPVAPGNLLEPRRGADVFSWNTLPMQADTGPERLLSTSGDAPPWVARLAPRGQPVVVDLRLAMSTETPIVARIEVDLATSEPAERWASEISFLVSATGEAGSWSSFGGTVLLHTDEARKVVEAAPVRARFLRVQVHKNRGDPSFVTLSRVRAYGPRASPSGAR